MKISRRNFLAALPVAAAALSQLNGTIFGQSAERSILPALKGDSLAMLSWDSFYPFINTEFMFGEGFNGVSLTLVDMTDSRSSSARSKSRQENFVMKFRGPAKRVLEQRTYRVNHFNLGDFDLFITDGGRVKREQYYIAVINRVSK